MDQSTSESLRFPPVAGMTVRAEFDDGALSSDVGPLILRGVDQHIGRIDRLVQAVDDRRHPSSVAHSLHDLSFWPKKLETYRFSSPFANHSPANGGS